MNIKNVLLRTAALPTVLFLGALAWAQTPNPALQPPVPATQSGVGAGTGAGNGSMVEASPSAAPSSAARFDARIASIKSELRLTEDQRPLWPAVETSLRDAFKQHHEGMERMRSQYTTSDIVEHLRLRGEMISAQGAAMTRLADAIKPLHDRMTDDQKMRFVSLMRLDRASGQGGMMRQNQSRGSDGDGYGREHDNHSNWRGRDQDPATRRGDNEGRYGHGEDNRYEGYQHDGHGPGSRDYGWQGTRPSQEPDGDAYCGYDRNQRGYGRYRDQRNHGQNGNGNQDFGYNRRQYLPDVFDDSSENED